MSFYYANVRIITEPNKLDCVTFNINTTQFALCQQESIHVRWDANCFVIHHHKTKLTPNYSPKISTPENATNGNSP